MTWRPLVITPWMREAFAEQALEQAAAVKLACVTPPRLWDRVNQEMERRFALFELTHRESPSRSVMGPKRAAIESLYDDLVNGRLQ